MEYMFLSCEEGEEITSSEVWPRGLCWVKSPPGLVMDVALLSVQDNEMEGSDSNDEEWKSDSSRYVCVFLASRSCW